MTDSEGGLAVAENQVTASNFAGRTSRRALLLLLSLALVAWLGYRWWWGLSHVSTDNAQVEAHVVPVLTKVGGFVTEIKVDNDQAVKAGDLIARIDDRDYRAMLAQSEADLDLALANAGNKGLTGQAASQAAAARATAAAARSGVVLAIANADKAQKDLERIRPLVTSKMLSPQALDGAEATARVASAQVLVSRETAASAGEQASALNAALRAALAKVESARAARDLVAIQLAETRIVAPADGVVANRNMEPGQLVAGGQPLLSLVSLDNVWVVANLKETDLRNVHAGDEAKVEVDAYPGQTIAGTVMTVGPATGARFALLPPDNATGNFTKVVQRVPVRIRVPQNEDSARPLRPGMSVFVTIATK